MKDKPTKAFKTFLVHFEKQFNCKFHRLRTDGGGEYKFVDLFCKKSGVRRQVLEAGNQASNGKVERMPRTVMNMVRIMIIGSGLLLSFRGNAAEYASLILNRSPTRGNAGRTLPLQVLTGVSPMLMDIVIFESPCTTIRTPKYKTIDRRGEAGLIIGKSDITKGYRVLFTKDRVILSECSDSHNVFFFAKYSQQQQTIYDA